MNNLINLSANSTLYSAGIIVLTAWSLVWKGLALWRSARKGQKYWYIAILVINTLGLLEIAYLLFFYKRSENKSKKKEKLQK